MTSVKDLPFFVQIEPVGQGNPRLQNLVPCAHPPGTSGPPRCDWPQRGAYISDDGKAMPCMVAAPDQLHFGDITRDGVAHVWRNAHYSALRARLDASVPPPAIWRSCALHAGTF